MNIPSDVTEKYATVEEFCELMGAQIVGPSSQPPCTFKDRALPMNADGIPVIPIPPRQNGPTLRDWPQDHSQAERPQSLSVRDNAIKVTDVVCCDEEVISDPFSASSAKNPYRLEEIKKAIALLFEPNQIVEVRIITDKKPIVSGWFDNQELMAKKIALIARDGLWEGQGSSRVNFYWTINPVNPSLLARQDKNKFAVVRANTSDADILSRFWIPVDIDPKRTSGVSSTKEELDKAELALNKIVLLLNELGFRDDQFVTALSGNGFHLLIRCDLPNDKNSLVLVRRVLTALQQIGGDDHVDIDQKVCNAARILKSYGTLARKGIDTEDRPHRMSRLLQAPAAVVPVSRELLEKLAAHGSQKKTSSELTGRPVTPRKWTRELAEKYMVASFHASGPSDYGDGAVRWQHDCIHDTNHRKPDAFSILQDGRLNHYCSHNSCREYTTQDWQMALREQHGDTEMFQSDDENATPETSDTQRIFPLTDIGNAERFEHRFASKFAWTAATGWLSYSRGTWRPDKTAEADQAMQHTIRLISEEVTLVEGDDEVAHEMRDGIIKWAKSCEANSRVEAALKRASKLKTFALDYAAFDNQSELFNVGNGTIHLETGKLLPHEPSHLLTKQSPIVYDPEAKCPQWEKFLGEVQAGNQEMIEYIQRWVGYSLSAETGEQCMCVLYGPGGTGKSTFLNLIAGLCGDYADDADPEMFVAKQGDGGQPFDLAKKEGVRMLAAVETEHGKRLATAKVKRMTGQDRIVACRKFHDSYTFTPVWKIWFATNDLPDVRASDGAIWDRLKVIPFTVKFRETQHEVRDLGQKLLDEEGPGILNWALEGYKKWKSRGLKHPSAVKLVVNEWHESEDYLASFLEERTEHIDRQNEYEPKAKLYQVFGTWAEETKEGGGLNAKRFSEEMRRKGYSERVIKIDGKTTRVWLGLKIKTMYNE